MTDLPAPLTPADSRGRNLGPMPLSDTELGPLARRNFFEPRVVIARIKMLQWAWVNNPACSIPIPRNPDVGYGRVVSESGRWWKAHKAQIIDDFVLCSDNLLYHPWLSDQANRILRRGRQIRETEIGLTVSAWKARRAAVFLRDDFTCNYCGERGGILECDHVIPLARGGSSDTDNLVTSCSRCNQSKGAIPLDLWRERP